MTNYFGIDILQFPLTLIIFLNFIFGIYNSSKLILKKSSLNNEIEIRLFFLFITLGTFISFINILLFFNYLLAKNIIFIFFSVFLVINFLCFKKKNIKKNLFKIKQIKNFSVLFIILLCYFLLSSLPLSDADSLSYHSSFGAYTIKYGSLNWLKSVDLIHPDFFVSGFTEMYNFIGLTLFSENFGSYLNFVSLILICVFFKNKFKLKKEKDFILLCVVSSPILLPMIISQKIFIFPSFILSLIFFYIYKNKKIQYLNELTILSCLMLILSFKISFLYPVSIAIIYIIYKNKNFLRTFLLSIFTGLIFFSPIVFKNIYFHGDLIPPFTGQIFKQNSEYLNNAAEFFKNYDLSLSLKNLIFLPILFLIPHYGQAGTFYISFTNIGKIFGLQFYSFVNLKNKINNEILIIFIVLIFSVFLSGNISTRWFLFIFFMSQIFICDSNVKFNIYFKKLIYIQILVFTLFILAYTFYSAPTLFSKDYKKNFLIKHANGYDFALKIKEIKKQLKLKNNEKILYTHRSSFWTDVKARELNFSNEWLRLIEVKKDRLKINDRLYNLIKENNVKILVIRHKPDIKKLIKNSFFSFCNYELGTFEAYHATRNPFFSGKKMYQWIYFGNSNLNKCIKND